MMEEMTTLASELDYGNFTRDSDSSDIDMMEYRKRIGATFNKTGFHTIIWGLRQGHGTLMSFVMFLITPIHLFMTRYMKESFMDKRILFSRVWYQVHLHGVFITLILFVASLTTAVIARNYLGVSLTEAGARHRHAGWTTTGLFVLLLLVGGFRGFHDPLRKITIFLHWLLGMLFYALMMFQMITAAFIPGNGVASMDSSYQKNGRQMFGTGAVIHVFAWIVFEFIIFIIMSCNSVISDKSMEVIGKRLYLPVAIPVIREHSSRNADGHGIRVIVMVVYILCCFISTSMYFIVCIVNTSWEGKGLGPMPCTHNPMSKEMYNVINNKDHFATCQ